MSIAAESAHKFSLSYHADGYEQPSRHALLSRFDIVCEQNAWTGDKLERASVAFWYNCMEKGYNNCPLPEYLVKFVNCEWDGQ